MMYRELDTAHRVPPGRGVVGRGACYPPPVQIVVVTH